MNRPAAVVSAFLAICPPSLLAWGAEEGASSSPQEEAARLVRAGGVSGGLCVLLGLGEAALPLALARQGPFTVHVLAADPGRVEAAREAIHAAGVYGTVSVVPWTGPRLPYADNLVTLAAADDWPALAARGLRAAEVFRALAPLGAALLETSRPGDGPPGWRESLAEDLRAAGAVEVRIVERGVHARKAWPDAIDEWTHYLHGPDGNPVARDVAVGPPRRVQWLADPVWMQSHETDSSVSTLVTARGRLFAIVNEAPTSVEGPRSPPDAWFLTARDAFNGVPLWKIPIPQWGWRVWRNTWFKARPGDHPLNLQKRLVAAGDRVYVTLGYRAPVSELDARTGAVLRTYPGTEGTHEILVAGGRLILSVLTDLRTPPGGGGAVRVLAVEAATGRCLWRSEKTYRGTTVDYIRWKEAHGETEPGPLDPASDLATDGTAHVALIDGPRLVCLDFDTGRERWSRPFPSDPADETAGRMKAGGNLWNGTLIVTGGVVLHASPFRLAALDAATGGVLWERPKAYIGHLWYEWKDVFVIDGVVWTWGEDLKTEPLAGGPGTPARSIFPQQARGYDLRTGALVRSVPLGPLFKAPHHHRCYRNKATSRYILASRRGVETVDLSGGPHTIDNWVRGPCHVGLMPANGLLYVPPHPCVCYLEEKINGMAALAAEAAAPAGGAPAGPMDPSRLERGPAYGTAPAGEEAAARDSDWPTFRHDPARTGAVDTRVDDALEPAWRVRVGRRLSPPVAAGDRVYVALVDEHQVACLAAREGREVWRFTAGGRVDSPPTVHGSLVVFGSADGWVTALRAADGVPAWRFRAAPEERLVGSFGQLESAWPVHGSVLVRDGLVYAAAGRSSHLDGGIHLYALEAATGRPRHYRHLEGPRHTSEGIRENHLLPTGALADVLAGDGGNLYMHLRSFDWTLRDAPGRPPLQPAAGYLDDHYFKRTPWRFEGSGDWGRLIVHDARRVYYVRMFDSLQGLNPDVYFTPGTSGYLLFARPKDGRRWTWEKRVPVRVRAMLAAGDRLLAAGPPDVVDPKDPLGAFENRRGGVLLALDAATGEKRAERALPFPPVFNGMAAAGGRLFVSEEGGHLAGFGR